MSYVLNNYKQELYRLGQIKRAFPSYPEYLETNQKVTTFAHINASAYSACLLTRGLVIFFIQWHHVANLSNNIQHHAA